MSNIEHVKWTIRDVVYVLLLWIIIFVSVLFIFTLVVISLKESVIEQFCLNETLTLLVKEACIFISRSLIAVFIITAVWFSIRKYGYGWDALGFVFTRTKKDIAIGILSGFVIFAVIRFLRISFISAKVILKGDEVLSNFLLANIGDQVRMVIFGMLINLLSVISQEVVFTGFTYPAFRKKFGVILGIAITALIFWFMHFGFESSDFFIGTFLIRFIPGICFVILYEKRRSLITPITAHFISNILLKIV